MNIKEKMKWVLHKKKTIEKLETTKMVLLQSVQGDVMERADEEVSYVLIHPHVPLPRSMWKMSLKIQPYSKLARRTTYVERLKMRVYDQRVAVRTLSRARKVSRETRARDE